MDIPDKLIKHIQPSGLNSKFDAENLSFPAYVSTVNHTLKNINNTFKLGLSDKIIDDNSPFEWRPEGDVKRGALLVHGLFDTPFIMRDVGKHLLKQGMLVRSILLPGHGSIPADLLTTSPTEWMKAVKYGIESFAKEVDELYLVGFSTGAALQLQYLLEHKHDIGNIAGLIMLCPAMAINAKKSLFLRLYRMFRWLFKEQKWIFRADNPDYAKYTSFPVNSGYLVQRVIVENKLLLKNAQCPVPMLIAMSENDETVRADVVIDFFKKTKNVLNEFILYRKGQQDYNDPRIKVVNSYLPEQQVLDLSHIAVPNAPDNHHYGVKGDYKEKITEPESLPSSDTIFLGAATHENETHYRMRRITFNPLFDNLMQDIDQFITTVSNENHHSGRGSESA